MTSSLPREVRDIFERFITCEYTTVDARQQPIIWPVTPYYSQGGATVDLTTGIGYPKKADDAQRNPHVALLFSDPTGSEMESPPQVLVQGTAQVDDRDLVANEERYSRESLEKLPATKSMMPPKFLRGMFTWYFARVYVHVRPERIYVWPDGDPAREPQLLDAHMEEVRSGHDEEPEDDQAPAEGGEPVWDPRMDELGDRYTTAVLSLVAPDGFPFSVRLPIEVDRDARRVRFGGEPLAIPLQPGLACLAAHDHHPQFVWQRNFHVRGDLVEQDGAWALIPHKMVGGFELPPTSTLARYRLNFQKIRRFRKKAKREMERRAG